MKLTYRGVTYNYDPQPLNLNNSHPTTTELKFRGNEYQTNQPVATGAGATDAVATVPATAAPVAQPAAPVTIEERARELMMNHHKLVKRRQQAMLTRLAANVGLDAGTTSQYWGHIQGKVQPGFWDSYDRSHASIS
ncbi:DUF4278 domain-containing protein [Thermoleptolyngbya oregonensis NK1-22]|uniref:DUF4278 domain-containing protein n=1 Tax=Thermoleptolyngbya oregonensis NK1-22 TaxID=2547457 RepID=A0AA96YBQ6_9CYAN|nr:DUF4278 domain-containing protein [Thermoleptolyngbya oregonensis]WOB43745.1 DUF4278 domain-containing protein [Thermoleptolyngbya oregonensis NK1-22]